MGISFKIQFKCTGCKNALSKTSTQKPAGAIVCSACGKKNKITSAIKNRGNFVISYTVKDKQKKDKRISETVGSNRRVAEQIYDKRKKEILEGKFQLKTEKLTLKTAVEGFLIKSEKEKESNTTRREKIASKHIFRLLKDPIIEDITVEDIEDYVDTRHLDEGAPGNTIYQELALLKNMFNRLIFTKKTAYNPANGVKCPEKNQKDRVLTEEEYGRLWMQIFPHMKPILILGYHTAMRISEILNLKWDRVNFKEKLIELKPEDTKTSKGRIIPLDIVVKPWDASFNPGVHVDLAAMLKTLPRAVHHKNVFMYKSQPIERINKGFANAVEKAKIGKFTFHDLRHTAITNWRRNGIPIEDCMAYAGHSSTAMFMRYRYIGEEDIKLARERTKQNKVNEK